jgi:hypothetical protein
MNTHARSRQWSLQIVVMVRHLIVIMVRVSRFVQGRSSGEDSDNEQGVCPSGSEMEIVSRNKTIV